MIDPVLKKFGLSQARKSVKNLNSNNLQTLRTPKKEDQEDKRQFLQTLPVPPHSRISTPIQRSSASRSQRISQARSDHRSDARSDVRSNVRYENRPNNNNTSKIQRLIHHLKSNYCTVCPHHYNERSLVKFLCLKQSCNQNLGLIIKKLKSEFAQEIFLQLDNMMKDSFDLIMSQKTVIKSQFIKQIDLQITNMCDQFHKNVQFFKNKALKQIDDHLFAKYEQLQILSSLKSSGPPQLNDNQLVMQILKIDIKGVEKDLAKQLHQLQFQKLNYQPVVKLFEQMNGAMGHFMSQFKKCFPRIYRIGVESYSQPKSMNKSSKRQQYGSGFISQFKSVQTEKDRNNDTNHQ